MAAFFENMGIQFQLTIYFRYNVYCLHARNILSCFQELLLFMLFQYNSGVQRAVVAFIAKGKGVPFKAFSNAPFLSSNSSCHAHLVGKMLVDTPPNGYPFATALKATLNSTISRYSLFSRDSIGTCGPFTTI